MLEPVHMHAVWALATVATVFGGGRPVRSLLDAVQGVARDVALERAGERWPTTRWQKDPVGFAATILGVTLWRFQVELLEAIRDHRHVAVAGGRKIGKDFAVAVASLWWFASWPLARVICIAPTAKQLDRVWFREVRMLLVGSGRCVDCKVRDPHGPRPCAHSAILTGEMGMLARTGIRAPDFREIVGYTALREGSLRGTSGARILAIEDEASDIRDEIDRGLVGDLASADCTRVAISNPTRTQGFFYRAFHEERDLFHLIRQSSEHHPNIVEGRQVIKGGPSPEWLAEREAAWGRGSPQWRANVEGEHVQAEQGQLVTIEAISRAESAWEEMRAEGRLYIGLDVAGESLDGDETVFAVRRGRKVLEIVAHRGLSADRILRELRALIQKHRVAEDRGDAVPHVVLDRDGSTGARVFDVVNAYRLRNDNTQNEYSLAGFQGSKPPVNVRMREAYRLNRDALFGGLVDAFREGLAIPSDAKLEAELVALRWVDAERGRSVLMPKSEIRDRLGRSCDRVDALALSCYGVRVRPPTVGVLEEDTDDDFDDLPRPPAVLSPFDGGIDPRHGAISPYGDERGVDDEDLER